MAFIVLPKRKTLPMQEETVQPKPIDVGSFIARSTLDDILDGYAFGRVKIDYLTVNRINLDDVLEGTFGLVKSTSISAGKIRLDETVNGTYSKILATAISAGKIKLSTAGVDVSQGYGLVASTDISAGHIILSTTIKTGEWYDESGVEIDATHGINIYGLNNAFTTRATKTGTIQCYVGADGKIYAGAGAVILDVNGITIKGEVLEFQDVNGVVRGAIFGNTGAYLHVVATQDLVLAGTKIRAFNDLEPFSDAAVVPLDLGASGTRWDKIYGRSIYADNLYGITTKAKQYTRAMTAASGDVAYTGVGFQPKGLIILAISGLKLSWGIGDSSLTEYSTMLTISPTSEGGGNSTIVHIKTGSDWQWAQLKSMDADGFTLTWNKGGTPSGTMIMQVLAFG